jgi:hypothetical protein
MDPLKDAEAPKTVSKLHALLIGCSYSHQNLPGTENDVKTMAGILEDFGFTDSSHVTKLCGKAATRDNIVAAWKNLAINASADDVVVIYYSGHGASITLNSGPEKGKTVQFLVPSDFHKDQSVFRGILDSEISKLLQKITRETKNVTYILDSCHSARSGRGPSDSDTDSDQTITETWKKTWDFNDRSGSKLYDNLIIEHMKTLRDAGELLENDNWSNPSVVRIAAAAADGSAWQYKKNGLEMGIMTEKLALMMKEVKLAVMRNEAIDKDADGRMASRQLWSWRGIMLGVKAHVELEFSKGDKPQKPRSAGADTRVPFSLTNGESNALLAVVESVENPVEKPSIILLGGRVHGIDERDEYILIPFQREARVRMEDNIVTAAVERVYGFKSMMSQTSGDQFLFEDALALPYKRHKRWQVSSHKGLEEVEKRLQRSEFLTMNMNGASNIRFQRRSQNEMEIELYGGKTRLGFGQLNDSRSIDDLLSTAHEFARAQNVLTFPPGEGIERLSVDMEIEIGVFINKKMHSLGRYRKG